MARKKISINDAGGVPEERADVEQSQRLGAAFDELIKTKFGSSIAPPPYVTPFGVKPLDALLGGGFISSSPIMFTSTPETGKSTVAFQLAKKFLDAYPESVVLYIDIEGSGNTVDEDGRTSRVVTFKLDDGRFVYEPIKLHLLDVFEMVQNICETKKGAEEKFNKEFKVLIIWDSVAATPSSKTEAAETPDNIIGVKARQLTFALDKYTMSLSNLMEGAFPGNLCHLHECKPFHL